MNKDKRGLEMAVGTIIIIVLAVLVLIVILVIWNKQTGIFSEFLGSISGKTNVDTLVTGCNSLVTQQAVYEYCCIKKEARYELDGEIKKEKLTCDELKEKEFSGYRVNELNCQDAGC